MSLPSPPIAKLFLLSPTLPSPSLEMEESYFDLHESSREADEDSDANASSNSMEMEDLLDGNAIWSGVQAIMGFGPFSFVNKRFFSFDTKTYNLMIACNEDGLVMDLTSLKKHDRRGIVDLKRWMRIKDDMCILSTNPNIKCIHLKEGLRLVCIEYWEGIIIACHARAHITLKETIEKIKSTWCTNIKKHGIPVPYGKSLVGACGCSAFPTLQENQCLGLQDRQGLEEGLGLQEWTGLQQSLGLQYKE